MPSTEDTSKPDLPSEGASPAPEVDKHGRITTRQALEEENMPRPKKSQKASLEESVGDKLGMSLEDIKKKQSLSNKRSLNVT